jgi:hypothetical protein
MSAQQVQCDMRELKAVNAEIKRLQGELTQFRIKKLELEKSIQEYLEKTDELGIKYQDLVIVRTSRKKREKKTIEEKEHDVIQLLQSKGITNADETYEQIIEAMRGKTMKVPSLKIKNENI